jgi:HEAT repeat protein
LCLWSLLAAASPGRAQSSASPDSRAADLGRAWTAIAAGKHEIADKIAEQLLRKAPMDHAALTVGIAARCGAGNPMSALDAYEVWLKGSQSEDVFLLEPVALETLAGLSASNDPVVVAAALTKLARRDGERARALLARAKASPALDGVAAALGDAAATGRLTTALSSPNPRLKQLALTQITRSAPSALNANHLAPLLGDPAPPLRAEAAKALAATGAPGAADLVRPLLGDQDPYVRASAAVALGHLGDAQGIETLEQMLNSPVADTAVMAAEVLGAKGVDVSQVAERALRAENPLTRLSAIPLIERSAPRRALDLLREAVRDSNPVVRLRAAAILSDLAVGDVALLRALLRDSTPEIRIHAAAALLALAHGR